MATVTKTIQEVCLIAAGPNEDPTKDCVMVSSMNGDIPNSIALHVVDKPMDEGAIQFE